MPITLLDDKLWFPPLTEANDDGLLAAGGDLSPGRLLLAYRSGIFPWFNEDEIPLWWSPDPRFVLFPDELRVSRSMKQVLRSHRFRFDIAPPFHEIITRCGSVNRPGQNGTWITSEIRDAFARLHEAGIVRAVAAWQDDRIVGGLYGILLGTTFFGESMFSLVPNASKFAFIHWVRYLAAHGVRLIDCQVYTAHLESLGARMISRDRFLELVSAGNP
jgi:leucyl/phenylalanyl-tRNA--protein transferase